MNSNNHTVNRSLPSLIFWISVFVSLFLFFQLKYKFHLYYIEQLQLFLYSSRYAGDIILQPGGLALYLSLFCVQLYIYPGLGALITAFLLTGVGLLLQASLKRLAPVFSTRLLAVLPVAALAIKHIDMNYRIQGTIGLLFMLGGLLVFTGITKVLRRLAAGIVLTPVLFLLAGPVAFLFACIALLWEIVNGNKKAYLFFLLPVEMFLIAEFSLRMGWEGEYRMLLLPDAYYEHLSQTNKLYLSWLAIIGSVVLCRLFSKIRKESIMLYGLQLSILPLFLLIITFQDARDYLKITEMDHYMRQGQWERIIEVFPSDNYNTRMQNMLNLALAQKGQLGDRLFEYTPNGPQSLISSWDDTASSALILSDIHYYIGDIPTAQKLAFEGFLSSPFGGNVRLLQRLVETNLIYGAYPVAEKYISILEQTYHYRNWAKEHRRYLYNEPAFAANKELGNKRKSLVKNTRAILTGNTLKELEQLVIDNPANQAAMQYLVSMYLTRKDLKNFQRLLETYAKTESWPSLSVSQQEAVIVLDQNNPFYWIRNGVTTRVEQQFRAFDEAMKQGRTQLGFAENMANRFGHSFWYYLMFREI